MKTVFVDTFFWVASMSPKASERQLAQQAATALGKARFVTTETVLIELLNYYAEFKPHIRQAAIKLVRKILLETGTEVVLHTPRLFQAGLQLYEARPDKGYSLTDCISMNVMRERGLTEVLTHDNHFTQEGFVVLI